MRLIKKILYSAVAIILFFTILELVARLFVFTGSYDYIERRIIVHELAQHKRPGEFRIFLYGESTMHGGALYPYSTIGQWIELYLADLLPPDIVKKVTVVNFARMGANSAFVATAFAETTRYKPDLAVFYTVHNDFCLAEHRLALFEKKSISEQFEDFCENLPKKSAFLNLINRAVIRAKVERSKIADKRYQAVESDSWYVEPGEPEAFRKDAKLLVPGSAQFTKVAENFSKNIDRILSTASRRHIPIILFEGLSRWEGYEPVRPMHDNLLSAGALAEWSGYYTEGESFFIRGEYDKALELFLKCIDIDKQYATTYYKAAECYRMMGKSDEANAYYIMANDHDYFPIRAPSCVNAVYEKIRASGAKGVEVIQTQKLIENNSLDGIVGEGLTIDQIHPSPEGQALMAFEIVKIMYKNGFLARRDKWRWEKLRSVNELKKMLDLDRENIFYVYTGTASYMARHYHEAAKALEKALAIQPNSVFVRSWLAWTYWNMGEKEKALGLYRQLYKEKPALAETFFKRQPEIKKALRPGP